MDKKTVNQQIINGLVSKGINIAEIELNHLEAFADIMYKAISVTRCCKSDSEQLKEKKIKDLLNWVKSDLKHETNNKIGKTATPYRTEKIKFLNKLLEIESL